MLGQVWVVTCNDMFRQLFDRGCVSFKEPRYRSNHHRVQEPRYFPCWCNLLKSRTYTVARRCVRMAACKYDCMDMFRKLESVQVRPCTLAPGVSVSRLSVFVSGVSVAIENRTCISVVRHLRRPLSAVAGRQHICIRVHDSACASWHRAFMHRS